MRALRFFSILFPLWFIAVFLTSVPLGAEEALLSADFSVHTGSIRPLHGINK